MEKEATSQRLDFIYIRIYGHYYCSEISLFFQSFYDLLIFLFPTLTLSIVNYWTQYLLSKFVMFFFPILYLNTFYPNVVYCFTFKFSWSCSSFKAFNIYLSSWILPDLHPPLLWSFSINENQTFILKYI